MIRIEDARSEKAGTQQQKGTVLLRIVSNQSQRTHDKRKQRRDGLKQRVQLGSAAPSRPVRRIHPQKHGARQQDILEGSTPGEVSTGLMTRFSRKFWVNGSLQRCCARARPPAGVRGIKLSVARRSRRGFAQAMRRGKSKFSSRTRCGQG